MLSAYHSSLYSLLSQPSPSTPMNPHPTHESKFVEHLSTTLTGDQVERSRFSSDTSLPRRFPLGTIPSTPRTAQNIPQDVRDDVESLRSQQPSRRPTSTYSNMVTQLFFEARTGDGRGSKSSFRPLSLSIPRYAEKAQPPLPATYPPSTHSPPEKKQGKRRFRWCTLLLILVILALLGNVAFLDVRVVELTGVINKNIPPSPSSTSTPSNPSSEAVGECLSQFTINAPSDPSAYPCSTCLSILSNMTNNSDAANATQFCGLRAILESTNTTGQTALSNGGWGKDLRVCTWSGVSCSDSGLVTSL